MIFTEVYDNNDDNDNNNDDDDDNNNNNDDDDGNDNDDDNDDYDDNDDNDDDDDDDDNDIYDNSIVLNYIDYLSVDLLAFSQSHVYENLYSNFLIVMISFHSQSFHNDLCKISSHL